MEFIHGLIKRFLKKYGLPSSAHDHLTLAEMRVFEEHLKILRGVSPGEWFDGFLHNDNFMAMLEKIGEDVAALQGIAAAVPPQTPVDAPPVTSTPEQAPADSTAEEPPADEPPAQEPEVPPAAELPVTEVAPEIVVEPAAPTGVDE